VDKIVKSVLNLAVLSATKFPVGLQSQVEELIESIKTQSTEVYTIAIIGAAGSGKTTLAKAVYDQLSGSFTGKSFIEDIGEDIWRWEERLASDVLKTKVPSGQIRDRLSGKRLLIVLDGLPDFYELEWKCREWFSGGTVIIITIRDEPKIYPVDFVYRIKLMNEDESLKLLSWHAFREAKPKEEYHFLAKRVVARCGGLPLALEVIGSYLYQRTKAVWKRVLFALYNIPQREVPQILKISFDGLSNQMEKDLFLDVCCFFVGKDRPYVRKILNGCGVDADSGIRVLIERNLIKVNKKNKLGMHPLLQEMGMTIIFEISEKKPAKNSRLRKNAEHVLREITVRRFSICGRKLLLKVVSFSCLIRFSLLFSSQGTKSFHLFPVRVPSISTLAVNPEYLFQKLRWIIAHRFSSQYPHNDFHVHDAIAIDLKNSLLQLFWKEPQVLFLAILH